MKRAGVSVLLEGLFLGIAFLFVWLVFADRKSREPWSWKELLLFGTGIGMAVMGAAIEVTL